MQNGANQCAYAIISDKDAPQSSPRLAFPPAPAFTLGSYGGGYGPNYSPPTYGSPAVYQPPMKSAALPPAPTLFGAAPVQLPAAYGLPAAQPPSPAVRWAWLRTPLQSTLTGEGMQILIILRHDCFALNCKFPDASVGSNGTWELQETHQATPVCSSYKNHHISNCALPAILCPHGSLDQECCPESSGISLPTHGGAATGLLMRALHMADPCLRMLQAFPDGLFSNAADSLWDTCTCSVWHSCSPAACTRCQVMPAGRLAASALSLSHQLHTSCWPMLLQSICKGICRECCSPV